MLSGYWVTFAAAADPNGDGRPLWAPVDADQPAILHIGATTQMGQIPHRDRLDLLDTVDTVDEVS